MFWSLLGGLQDWDGADAGVVREALAKPVPWGARSAGTPASLRAALSQSGEHFRNHFVQEGIALQRLLEVEGSCGQQGHVSSVAAAQ